MGSPNLGLTLGSNPASLDKTSGLYPWPVLRVLRISALGMALRRYLIFGYMDTQGSGSSLGSTVVVWGIQGHVRVVLVYIGVPLCGVQTTHASSTRI